MADTSFGETYDFGAGTGDPDIGFESNVIPGEYVQSLDTIAPGITQILQETGTDTRPWYESLLAILPSINATVQQRDLLQAQIERARLGLPAIGAAELQPPGLSKDTKQLFLYGGLAAAGVLFFLYSQNQRRR